MKKDLKKTIREKGQGLTEYVLIIAFIAGVAMMMFGGNGSLKGTVVGTFTETVRILAGLFSENDGYVTASKDTYRDKFKVWSKLSSEDLKREASSEERLRIDQEGLALIGNFFLGLTKAEVAARMGVGVKDPNKGYSNTYNSAASWLSTNLDADRMGPVNDDWSDIMVPLSYWNADFDNDGYYWLEASKNANFIKDMAGENNKVDAKKVTFNFGDDYKPTRSVTYDRIFYSDGMIGSDSSNRAVAVQVHYNGETVDKVRVRAVDGVKQQNVAVESSTGNPPRSGYDKSPGYSALAGEAASDKVKGLDITVTGPKDNYKYKVN